MFAELSASSLYYKKEIIVELLEVRAVRVHRKQLQTYYTVSTYSNAKCTCVTQNEIIYTLYYLQ